MTHLKKLLLLAVAAVAAMSIGASTASAQLTYTGPIHATQEFGVLQSEDGAELVCEGSAEGAITDAGFPAHGDLSEINFTDCLVFGFIECHVEVGAPLEIHASPATTDTLEFHIESAVEVTRECPFVGTCHYNAAPNTIEGVYSEAANTLTFTEQPLVGEGDCGLAFWTSEYHVDTPAAGLHW